MASDPAAAIPGGMDEGDEEDDDAYLPPVPPVARAAAGAAYAPVMPTYSPPESSDDEDAAGRELAPPPRVRHRERDLVHGDRAGRPERPDGKRSGPAPEWERAKPLEAYPTIRSRRLAELSIPPILVAVVALALAAAVLFALPGLLGFGNPAAPAHPRRRASRSTDRDPERQPDARPAADTADLPRPVGRHDVQDRGPVRHPAQRADRGEHADRPGPEQAQDRRQQVIIPAKDVASPSEIPAAS